MRARMSPSTFTRSTITCSVARSLSVAAIDVLERDRLAVDVEPPESLAAQRRERLGDRDRRGPADPAAAARPHRRRWSRARSRLRRQAPVPACAPSGVDGHDRHVEPDQQPRAVRERAELASRPPPAVSRMTSRPQLRQNVRPDPGVEQAQVVVDLGRRPDGGTRVADAVLLADRDRRDRCPRSQSTSGFSIRSRNWRA